MKSSKNIKTATEIKAEARMRVMVNTAILNSLVPVIEPTGMHYVMLADEKVTKKWYFARTEYSTVGLLISPLELENASIAEYRQFLGYRIREDAALAA